MSDSVGDKAAGCAVILAGVGVLAAIGSVVRGMVLTKLWAWFIVPTFGLPLLCEVKATEFMGYKIGPDGYHVEPAGQET